MINLELRGCGTALVTPFDTDQRVDESALERLVESQIEGGIDFLVPCGTTGESVTLSEDEQARVVELTVKTSRRRVPVVAGAGGYNTMEVVHRARRFGKLGIDAILSVTPYYNRPTQEGLFEHYRTIAEGSPVPVVLYNVPGRTGCNLEPSTVARIAQIDGIIGIKEASGNISQIAEIASLVDDSFRIFAGDDSVVLPVAAIGGVGVISVTSNLLPKQVSQLAGACLAGNYDEARLLYRYLLPIFKAMFIETSPIPVKAAMAMAGMIEEVYRLPLVPLSDINRQKLRRVLVDAEVIQSFQRAV
ncbi:MAG: 4-hydroxy-tetrahydrodipicolinate synthase [Acidobacteriota bacterium]